MNILIADRIVNTHIGSDQRNRRTHVEEDKTRQIGVGLACAKWWLQREYRRGCSGVSRVCHVAEGRGGWGGQGQSQEKPSNLKTKQITPSSWTYSLIGDVIKEMPEPRLGMLCFHDASKICPVTHLAATGVVAGILAQVWLLQGTCRSPHSNYFLLPLFFFFF